MVFELRLIETCLATLGLKMLNLSLGLSMGLVPLHTKRRDFEKKKGGVLMANRKDFPDKRIGFFIGAYSDELDRER